MTARRTRTRLLLVLLPLLLAAVATVGAPAQAHATIVFAELAAVPNPPPAGEPFTLQLAMVDPTQLPVEDALVLVELTSPSEDRTVTAEFRETAPGVYAAEVTLEQPGEYRALMRDRTFRQEEAQQTVTLTVGGAEPLAPIEFVFPPTAVSGGVTLWLAWLIGVPLLVGIVVTVVVLLSGRSEGAEADA